MSSSANSSRDFADNVGIKFLTPEEYFLEHKPRDFKRAFDPRKFVEEKAAEGEGEIGPFFTRSSVAILLTWCTSFLL